MLIESKSASAVADHLFRHEAGKMIARLTRTFGPHRFDLAEEAVQDALCTALETWKFYGIPDDPGAWLMRVARNRAIDLIRRGRRFEGILDALAVEPSSACVADVEGDWPHDDRLLLIFSCCDPLVSVDAQLALILKALCGFSLGEIGAALFASPSAIEKRVTRTKGFLKRSKSLFDFTDAGQVRTRLDSVHQALYLIFSEGYHSVRADAPVRNELCREAIRLALLIAVDRTIGTPATDALLAMMYLDLARLAGRVDEEGVFLPLSRQDRSRWDQRLIAVGFRYLGASAKGGELSRYHLEAAIAAEHCRASSFEQTDWRRILELYEMLAFMSPTPVVALNRAIVRGQVDGAVAGLAALDALGRNDFFQTYPFFHAAFGEFRLRNAEVDEAAVAFKRAFECARSTGERNFFVRRLGELKGCF